MSVKFHKAFNIVCYIICLGWGEWVIIHLFSKKYLIIFLISFVYSALLGYYYRAVKNMVS